MAQNITWPSVSVTATNPSVALNGQSPSATSSTLVAGQDPSGDQQALQTDSSGALLVSVSSGIANPLPVSDATINARLSGSLVPAAYDQVDLTYVPSGPGAGQVATAVYKLATVTVKTLTLTYDGSDRLSSVVAS